MSAHVHFFVGGDWVYILTDSQTGLWREKGFTGAQATD